MISYRDIDEQWEYSLFSMKKLRNLGNNVELLIAFGWNAFIWKIKLDSAIIDYKITVHYNLVNLRWIHQETQEINDSGDRNINFRVKDDGYVWTVWLYFSYRNFVIFLKRWMQ